MNMVVYLAVLYVAPYKLVYRLYDGELGVVIYYLSTFKSICTRYSKGS